MKAWGHENLSDFTDKEAEESKSETYPEVDIECITVPKIKDKKKLKVKKENHKKGGDSSDSHEEKHDQRSIAGP